MADSEINDIRSSKDFKGITFSNYKKSDCKNKLLKALIDGTVEPACYWSIEYICAGHFLELWEIIILFSSKFIHLGNPRLSLYLSMRFNNFKDLVQTGYIGNEIKLRNNIKIRALFSEVICILCLSIKKHNLSQIKIDKSSFNMSNMTEKLKADNVYYAKDFFKKDDPKELFIALNEFVYNIRTTKSSTEACFWLEWILEFENICKKENNFTLTGGNRYIASVESKFANDIIWIIWEILLSESEKFGINTKKIIQGWLELYAIRYKKGCKRKRRFIIYCVISLLTECVNINVPIYTNEEKIKTVKNKIHLVYKDVKKFEKKPATDYLFNNSIAKNTNLEKTIAKLDIMSKLTTIIHK